VLAGIAFCPQPPLLVPELAAGAAAELDELRAACAQVVRRLLADRPDRVVVLGPGPRTAAYGPGASGTLAGYGVPVTASLGPAVAPPGAGAGPLPPALTLGAWLLGGVDVRCAGQAVGPDADPAEPAAGLAGGTDRTALLVMADGSACRSESAPGYADPRAGPFDAAVAAALRSGDPAALRDLDPAAGRELLAAGVPAWRVAGHAAGAGPYDAELLHDAAPYGVGYLVAAWTPR
jgi:hypothetical protein